MLYLTILLAAILLFLGFIILVAAEGKRGIRFLEDNRARLDTQVARALFVASHIDWSAFTKHLIREGAERAAHDAAHAILVLVRFLERMLTRAVRALRERRSGIAPVPHTNSTFDTMIAKLKSAVHHSRTMRVVDVKTPETNEMVG